MCEAVCGIGLLREGAGKIEVYPAHRMLGYVALQILGASAHEADIRKPCGNGLCSRINYHVAGLFHRKKVLTGLSGGQLTDELPLAAADLQLQRSLTPEERSRIEHILSVLHLIIAILAIHVDYHISALGEALLEVLFSSHSHIYNSFGDALLRRLTFF